MPNEKLFTAKEAAEAVLAKAQEMLKSSTLAKAETGHEKGVQRQVLGEKPGVSRMGMDVRAGNTDSAKSEAKLRTKQASQMKPGLGKAEGAPAEKDQSGPDGVKNTPNPATPNDKVNGNPAPGAFPQNEVKYAAEGGTKGHIKLAKFVGRMEEKRKAKSAPASTVEAAAINKSEYKTGAQHAEEGAKRQAAIAQKQIAEKKGPRAGDLGTSLNKPSAPATAKPKLPG